MGIVEDWIGSGLQELFGGCHSSQEASIFCQRKIVIVCFNMLTVNICAPLTFFLPTLFERRAVSKEDNQIIRAVMYMPSRIAINTAPSRQKVN